VIVDYLRLALATALVLAPGRLIARSLGLRTTSATLGCALGVMFFAWAVVFTVHGSVWLALALVALSALLAPPLRVLASRRAWPSHGAWQGIRRPPPVAARSPRGVHRLVFGAGVLLGLLLWRVAGVVSGDGLFHLARVRKLVDLGGLHLRSVDEFVNGGLHPGYAFPLWHGFLALVSVVSGLDPSVVVNHEASVLAPLAVVVVFEAGFALFGSAGAGVAVVAGTLGLFCFAAGHGGSYVTLALPPTAARQLLVPAFYALFFGYLRSGRRVELGVLFVLFGSLALIHSTYALFSLIPLGAYALVRPREWRRTVAALGAAVVPAAAVYLWLRPLIDQTLTHNPSAVSVRQYLLHYSGQLVIGSLHSHRLAADVVGRSGAVAVAALALAPLGAVAMRRRWGSFVVAGTVAVLALMLIAPLFVHFSDLVSLSQSRRAAGFVPFAFAFAGGLLLVSRRALAVPLALVAGIVLQLEWPGDFGTGQHGGPSLVTWFALVGGAGALAVGLVFARRTPRERPTIAALASLAFVLPVVVHGFASWTPVVETNPQSYVPPALHAELARLPPRTVVIAPVSTSYVILADFPLYVVAAPLAHVAHTRANDPEARIKAVNEWLKTGNPAIPRRYLATWAVEKDRLVQLRR
jgi:hypothetical protein